MESALAKIYATNPAVQAQRARIRQSDEEVAQALSNWRPTITVSGVAGQQRVSASSAFLTSGELISVPFDQDLQPRGLSLTITQPLYRGGRTQAETERAEFDVRSERARLLVVEQSTLVAGVRAYMDVLRDAEILGLSASNERVLLDLLRHTRDRYAAAEVTSTDVVQADARLQRARADRMIAEQDFATSLAAYERIVGEPPLDLQYPTRLPLRPATRDEAVSRAGTENPSVAVAEFTEKAQLAATRVVEGELLPRVNLTGGVARNLDAGIEGAYVNERRVQLEVVIPLYQAGSVESRVRQAKQLASQRRIELDDARRAATEAAASSWDTLTATEARMVALNARIAASTAALDGVRDEAELGIRTVLEVLNAEQELLTGRLADARNRRDQMVSAYQLAAALGAATAERLMLPVDFYDFESNYLKVRNRWFGTDADTITPVPEQ